MDYKIKAIPTVYRGRRYRSRLEARWAAFFDMVRWKAEYEPYDLGIWSPDFLLTGTWESGHEQHVLVEIKPINEFDLDAAAKMYGALESLGENDPRRHHTLLLLGVSPLSSPGKAPNLGWVVEGEWDDDGNALGPQDQQALFKVFAGNSGIAIDFSSVTYGIGGILTGRTSMFEPQFPAAFCADLLEIPHSVNYASKLIVEKWSEATNAVQWRPSR